MLVAKFKLKTIGVCSALVMGGTLLAGCASSPGGIEPAHISSSKYGGYSCSSLRAKGRQVSKEAQRVAGKVQDRSTDDALMTGVAIVLFWPAAFFVKGDGPEAEQYAQLIGERQAIEEASKRKGCGIKFAPLTSANSKENPRRKNKDVSPLEY